MEGKLCFHHRNRSLRNTVRLMSYGEYLVERYLKAITQEPFIKNYRPSWLMGLELDFFFPSLSVGIEFQGDHHYMQTEYSHDVNLVKRRDRSKSKLCARNGIHLIKLDGIDLWWPRFRRKIKVVKFLKRSQSTPTIQSINIDASHYRKHLKSKFGSITCVRPNHWTRNSRAARRRETRHLIEVIGAFSAEN